MVTYDITGLCFTKHSTEERNQPCFFVITFQMFLEVKETGLFEPLFFSGKKEGLKAIIYLTILSVFFFSILYGSPMILCGASLFLVFCWIPVLGQREQRQQAGLVRSMSVMEIAYRESASGDRSLLQGERKIQDGDSDWSFP